MRKRFVETKKTYNKIARAYHQFRIEGKKFHNEYLEMPTTLKLLGNVKGKKILDLGCGTGIYAKILTGRGAKVKGIDISEEEIKIARKEVPKVEFKVGSAEKLPYKNKEFDIVLAALVLEHFKDWNKVLKETHRVLKLNGLFIFSMGNPVVNSTKKIKFKGKKFRVIKDYFKEDLRTTRWWRGVYMGWYHKTFGTIIKSLIENDFSLEDYEDAKPLKKAKKLFPDDYNVTINMPYFCTWKWRRKNDS